MNNEQYNRNVDLMSIKNGDILRFTDGIKDYIGIIKEVRKGSECVFYIVFDIKDMSPINTCPLCVDSSSMSCVSFASSADCDEIQKKLRTMGLYFEDREMIQTNGHGKFNDGDIIINDSKTICCKIISCKSHSHLGYEFAYYDVVDIFGNENRYYIYTVLDNNFHLWTIDDAVPGDIIACGPTTCVFKSFDKKRGKIIARCSCNSTVGFPVRPYETEVDVNTNYVCPATKERQDFLFFNLNICGYEYNKATGSIRKIRRNK